MQTAIEDRILKDPLYPAGPAYELPEHRTIGHILDNYGIPFVYRQPTLIYEHGQRTIWRPDFTLPTHQNMVVDYLMPRNEPLRDYKQYIYNINDILALLINNYDLMHPDRDASLHRKITQTYDHSSYRAPP